MGNLIEQEVAIDQLLHDGEKDLAIQGLFELIVSHAKNKNFIKAESLREKLISLDAMALKAIVESAELIEAEKAASIDSNHIASWHTLYSQFSDEEKNAFYYSLKNFRIEAGQEIIAQGRLNNTLYLINSGRLNVVINQENHATFIRAIGAQELAGEDTFFPISVCTTSVIVAETAEVSAIERSSVMEIDNKHPGFFTKLETFCNRQQPKTIEEILKAKEIERRKFKRYPMDGRVHAQLIDKENKPLGAPFSGNLAEISAGGASFMIKCTKKETARMLLGRRAQFKIHPGSGASNASFTIKGIILSVRFHLFSDYSVHLRFGQTLKEDDIKQLVAMGTP